METPAKINVFVAYSREDVKLRDEFLTHLKIYQRQGWIGEIWHDGEIEAGSNWEAAIHDALGRADVVFMLISANSLASDYFYEKEMQHALAKNERGDCIVLPIILSECSWEITPFAKLQVLPKDGEAVTGSHWRNNTEAFHDIMVRFEDIIRRRKKMVGIPPPPQVEIPTAGIVAGNAPARMKLLWWPWAAGLGVVAIIFILIYNSRHVQPPPENNSASDNIETNDSSQDSAQTAQGQTEEQQRNEEAQAWADANRANTVEAYNAYLSAFPNGQYTTEARNAIHRLEDDAAWKKALGRNNIAAYNAYLTAFPNGQFAVEAQRRIANLQRSTGLSARFGYIENESGWVTNAGNTGVTKSHPPQAGDFNNNAVVKGILSFDISSLPPHANISKAKLYLVKIGLGDSDDQRIFEALGPLVFEAIEPADQITAADFDARGYATILRASSLPSNVLDIKTAIKTAISSGYNKFRLRFAFSVGSNNDNNGNIVWLSDASPYIVLDYTE